MKQTTLKVFITVLIFVTLLLGNEKYAGFRSSRVMPGSFPEPVYWSKVCHIISDKFENVQPAGVWIVSTYWDNGLCRLHFPHPGNGKSYEHISFDNHDLNEPYLDLFDQTGVKVWLQVESGDANMDTLISLVMERYKHHPSVIGFGVDAEWYFNGPANDYCGRKITDDEAETWENHLKSYCDNYTLTLKHWDTINMPPNYRGGTIFINDSQDFDNLNQMLNEFKYWGDFYKDNPVIFQFGYNSDVDSDGDTDEDWWGLFDDPVKMIGESLFAQVDNCLGIYWVDFTLKDVFPVTEVLTKIDHEDDVIQRFQLNQNYPNPFNSRTTIEFCINQLARTELQIFDVQGCLVKTLVASHLTSGKYQITVDMAGLSTGIYHYRLVSGNQTLYRKMLFVK